MDWKLTILTFLPGVVVVAVFGSFIYWFIVRESLANNRIRSSINREAINGNEVAIAMKGYYFRPDWKDEDLIMAALGGNEHARRALGVKTKGD